MSKANGTDDCCGPGPSEQGSGRPSRRSKTRFLALMLQQHTDTSDTDNSVRSPNRTEPDEKDSVDELIGGSDTDDEIEIIDEIKNSDCNNTANFQGDDEGSDSDIEVLEFNDMSSNIIQPDIFCPYTGCRLTFLNEESCNEHLSDDHFRPELERLVRAAQPTAAGSDDLQLACPRPRCRILSSSIRDAVRHLGVFHREARRLVEEERLRSPAQGVRPSLFALDAEAPGELVPDLPSDRDVEIAGRRSSARARREVCREEAAHGGEGTLQPCLVCPLKLQESEYLAHMALTHYRSRLEADMLGAGWVKGSSECPSCGQPLTLEPVLHWATNHGALRKVLGKRARRVEVVMRGARRVVTEYLAGRKAPRPALLINHSQEMHQKTTAILQAGKRCRAESPMTLDMDVDEEEDDSSCHGHLSTEEISAEDESEVVHLPAAPRQHPPLQKQLSSAPQQLSAASLQQPVASQQQPAAPQQVAAAPQQLSPASQQLPAAPQQLAAAPQQLSDAPLQLFAAPQLLSDAPQQLSDAPQQLSAAQQQLSASQPRLSAAQPQLCAAQQQLPVSTAHQQLSTSDTPSVDPVIVDPTICAGDQQEDQQRCDDKDDFSASQKVAQVECPSRRVAKCVEKNGGTLAVMGDSECSLADSRVVQIKTAGSSGGTIALPEKNTLELLKEPLKAMRPLQLFGGRGRAGQELPPRPSLVITVERQNTGPAVTIERRPVEIESLSVMKERSGSGLVVERQQSGPAVTVEHRKPRIAAGALGCKICPRTCDTRGELLSHLALEHFKEELCREMGLEYQEAVSRPSERKCPSCCSFRHQEVEALLVHYGAHCKPFPVSKLYTDYMKKHHMPTSSEPCVFCDSNCSSPEDLLAHIAEKHIRQVNFDMGLVWSYSAQGCDAVSCPTCVQIKPADKLCLHYIRNHPQEFRESLRKYRAAIQGGSPITCTLCCRSFARASECLDHIALHHFKNELLSECGMTLTQGELACCFCPFTSTNQDKILIHIATEHQRLNVFYTDDMLRLAEEGKIRVHKKPQLEPIRRGDYRRLTQYLTDSTLREYLSCRRYLLDSTSPEYGELVAQFGMELSPGQYQCKICCLVLPSEVDLVSHVGLHPHNKARVLARLRLAETCRQLHCKLCLKSCSDETSFARHQAEVHFFDELLLEGTRSEPAGQLVSCPDCPGVSLRPKEFVCHRQVRHGSAVRLYKQFQVSQQMLKCRLCPPTIPPQASLAALKYHVGMDHLKDAMMSCIAEQPGDCWRCSLCGHQLAPLGTPPEVHSIARHVAVVHNFIGQAYLTRTPAAAQRRETTYRCQLCPGFATPQILAFFGHLARYHVQPHFTADTLVCPVCHTSFPNVSGLVGHVTAFPSPQQPEECNLALFFYYKEIDDRCGRVHVRRPWPEYMRSLRVSSRTDTAAEQPPLPPLQICKSAFVVPNFVRDSDFIEDPVSSPLRLQYDLYGDKVSVEFEHDIPVKSFRGGGALDETSTCFFCQLVDRSYLPGDQESAGRDPREAIDRLLIHLAEEHFCGQLRKMFAHPHREGYFRCCEEDFNRQTFIGHIKECHSLLQNMYSAAVPRGWPLSAQRNTAVNLPEPQLICQLLPWLPGALPPPLNLHARGAACCLCNWSFEDTAAMIAHCLEHFTPRLVGQIKPFLTGGRSPVRCPLCNFVPSSMAEDDTDTELFIHLAKSHKETVKNISSISNSQQKDHNAIPQHQVAGGELPIKEEAIDPVDMKLENTACYVQPRPYQCLECHQDLKDMLSLGNHMREAGHLNTSWALHSNSTKQHKAAGEPHTGRWFQKLDVSLRCSFCVRKATTIMSIHRFSSIREVFFHILHIHMNEFRAEYTQTTLGFGLCKLCNGFIHFEDCDNNEDAMLAKELDHYLSHGRIFMIDLGLAAVTSMGGSDGGNSQQVFICNLCSSSFKSSSSLMEHLRFNHRDQVIGSYRDFSRRSLGREPVGLGDEYCCLCRQTSSGGLSHLASHGKQLLSEMGLLELHQADHKTSKMTCRCCRLVEKSTTKIVEHFAAEHKELFQYLRRRMSQQNYGLHLGRPTTPASEGRPRVTTFKPVQQPVHQHLSTKIVSVVSADRRPSAVLHQHGLSCKECSVVAPDTQSLKEHLVNQHRFEELRQHLQEQLDRTCLEPACSETAEDLCFHYWMKHSPGSKEGILDPIWDQSQPSKSRLVICSLCRHEFDSTNTQDYYKHIFYIHENAHKRDAIRDVLKNKNSTATSVACPQPGCGRHLPSLDHLARHYGSCHCTLDFLLNKEARTGSKLLFSEQGMGQIHESQLDPDSPVLPQQMFAEVGGTYDGIEESESAGGLFACHNDLEREPTPSPPGPDLSLKISSSSRRPSGDYNSAFLSFLNESCVAPVFTSRDRKEQCANSAEIQRKEAAVKATDAKCKLCNFIFESVNSRGEVKPAATVRLEEKNHYLAHFRDTILRKYPQSFSGPLPLKCSKCDFVVRSKVAIMGTQIKHMITHIASCNRELETLIEGIGKEQSEDVPVVIKAPTQEPEALKMRNREDQLSPRCLVGVSLSYYLNQNQCLLCKSSENFDSQINRRLHCVDHFYDSLCSIFKDYIRPTEQETKACAHSDCRTTFSGLKMDNRGLLRRFFVHMGFAHDYIEKLFFHRKANCFPIPKLSMKDGSYESLLTDRFWAIRAGGCLVCPASNLNTRLDRIRHYCAHFTQLDHIFGSGWEKKKVCFICGMAVANVQSYRWHLYEVHFQLQIKANMKCKGNGLFQCQYCKEEHSNPDRLAKHLINTELMLDVLCLKHVRMHKIKVSKLYEADTDMREMELVEVDDSGDEIMTELTTIVAAGEGTSFSVVSEETEYDAKVHQFLEKAKTNLKPFVQNAPCYMIDKRLYACHECQKVKFQADSAALSGACCCFEGFRKLRYSEDGQLLMVGYLDVREAKASDIEIWTPNLTMLHKDMSNGVAFFILKKIGDLLCNLLYEEKTLRNSFSSSGKQIIWKRQHQGVREMCDVCSTSIFDLHFTCSACGLLVCNDCYLARRLGTKYRSLGMMNKPYRTHKRLRANLDVNLWPLCVDDRIHDLDRLLLTQMSPSQVTESIVSDIHEIKKFYNLPSSCFCCKTPDGKKAVNSAEIEKSFSVSLLEFCQYCNTSFKQVSLVCKRVHLACHLAQDLLLQETAVCDSCDLNLGSRWVLLVHLALVHKAVDILMESKFIETEARQQQESDLSIDEHESCKICCHKFDGVKQNTRQHYINHLSEKLFDKVPANAPFKCPEEECQKSEFNRHRLMVHCSIIHKKLETALSDFLNKNLEEMPVQDSYSSWMDIPFCVVCNESHLKTTASAKRAHYFKHFSGLVEKHVRTRFNQQIGGEPSFVCPISGCSHTHESKTLFMKHLAFKHRIIDQFIEGAAKSVVEKPSVSSDVDVFFMKRCEVCDQDLAKPDPRENLKFVRSHYSIHFQDKISETFPAAFSRDLSYLSCPFPSCSYSTVSLKSDQYGHHKRKLVGHLGIDHEVFKKMLKEENILSKDNGPSTKYLYHDVCKICGEVNDKEPWKKRTHLFKHLRFVMAEQFQQLSAGSWVVKCPYCKYSREGHDYDTNRLVCIHIGHEHGVFDKLIHDYTKRIDYEILDGCQVCSVKFEGMRDKAVTVKEHYADHFAEEIKHELHDISNEKCWFCKRTFSSERELIIHAGDRHGLFWQMIEKHQAERECEELDDSMEDHDQGEDVNQEEEVFSVFQDEASFQCLLCGQFVCISVSENIKESVSMAMEDHLDVHMKCVAPVAGTCTVTEQNPGVEGDTSTLFTAFGVENVESLFIPVLKDFEHCVIAESVSGEGRKTDEIPVKRYHQEGESNAEVSVELGNMPSNIIDSLSSCFVCNSYCNFSGVNNLTVKLHLVRHFVHELASKLTLEMPFVCPECRSEFKNRFCLVIHFGIVHDNLSDIIKNFLKGKDVHTSVQSQQSDRSTRAEILRYTLPEDSKRFKSICLLCGSPVVLASTYRLESTTDVTRDQLLKEGMSGHLLSKHFAEYFTEPADNCQECRQLSFPYNKAELRQHLVSSHTALINAVIQNVCGNFADGQTESVSLETKDLFVSLDCRGFVDSVSFDFTSLNEVGIRRDNCTDEEQLPSFSTPVEVTATPSAISFEKLTSYHKLKQEWNCDFCSESFVSVNLISSQHMWKNHVLGHFEAEFKNKLPLQYHCEDCCVDFKSSLSMVSHYAFQHKELDLWLSQNHAWLHSRLEEIEHPVSRSLKRSHDTITPGEEAIVKKNKLEDQSKISICEAFECDICQTCFASSSEESHIFQHLAEDLKKTLGVSLAYCLPCHAHFRSGKDYVEHVGLFHGHARLRYKKLTKDEMSVKQAKHMGFLAQQIPQSCQMCSDNSYMSGNGKARVMEYLNHICSCHNKCLENIYSFKRCVRCNIEIPSPQQMLLHCFIEHNDLIKKAILTTVSEDWENLGGLNCELCSENYVFSVPSVKRNHLAIKHFSSDISKFIQQEQASYMCPQCPYLSYLESDTVAHISKNHRLVDDLLLRALLAKEKTGKGPKILESVSVCPLCIAPCSSSEKVSHLADHFFSQVIAPQLNALRCQYDGCSYTKIASRRSGAIYGEMTLHLGALHASQIYVEFLTASLRMWLNSGEDLLALQQTICNLLRNKTCVLCYEDFAGSPQTHFEQHFKPIVENLIKDEAPYQCELCDGFPHLSSVQQLRDHHIEKHIEEHVDLDSILKSFAFTDQLKKQRALLFIVSQVPRKTGIRLRSQVPLHTKRCRSPSWNSEATTDSSSSSRSTSSEDSQFWTTPTAGRRPPAGLDSLARWKEGKLQCEFAGCSGYREEAYYSHLSLTHFRDLLMQDLGKEMVDLQQHLGRYDWNLLACPRCLFHGDQLEDLLEHYGEYHGLVDYYVEAARRSWGLVSQRSEKLELAPPKDGKCRLCGFRSGKRSGSLVRHMCEHHLQPIARLQLPACQPFICPVCWYEAATRLSLLAHVAANHAAFFQAGVRSPFRWQAGRQKAVPPREEQQVECGLTMLQVIVRKPEQSPAGAVQKPVVIDLSISREVNPLGAFIQNMIGDVAEDSDSESVDHGLSAQIRRWCELTGSRPGVVLGYPDGQLEAAGGRTAEPEGLRTLAPRHALTMQESACLDLGAAGDIARTATAGPTISDSGGVPSHNWLCDGRLLHLTDAVSPANLALFQYQWARGQPVLISNSNRYLDRRLWHPRAFLKDFGHLHSDLINTLTGRTVPQQPLKWFWEGFNSVSHRLVDASGTPMLLKLKDWPPDGDIAEYIPRRFHDLIHDFPIRPYTLREGNLNLASYMPDYLLRPELGPKMYIAYGNALYSNRASTNLHLDMSDAVNLLVYVGLPDDCDAQENIKLVLQQVDEAGCDLIMKRRVREKGELPGALWHIFHPGDTNKIRDLLNKVAIEKGKRLDPHDDPIHDQSTYLDTHLRNRLYKEYGVQGYAIIQCAGDTVFVPAGACHQVRNLHNCIKIAEDFVSPELANNCLHLTQEFRHLTEHHTNHEDKLQIKSIIYHSVKNAVCKLKEKMKEDIKKMEEKEKKKPTRTEEVKTGKNGGSATKGSLA